MITVVITGLVEQRDARWAVLRVVLWQRHTNWLNTWQLLVFCNQCQKKTKNMMIEIVVMINH